MKRGPDDLQWQDLKKRIAKRDHGSCRLLGILSLRENMMLCAVAKQKDAKRFIPIIDPAHIFPVSRYPHLCYEDDNVVLLNRFAHDCLEDKISPFTGELLEDEDYNKIFIRIVGEKKFNTLTIWANNPDIYQQEKNIWET